MDRHTALALAIVAVEEIAEIDQDPDWGACYTVLRGMLREERQRGGGRACVHSKMQGHWEAIEHEFGEPVREVLEGMRAQGATWQTIAGTLGTTTNTLLCWRLKMGMVIDPGGRNWDDLSRENFKLHRGGGYGRWNGKHAA